jgi:hypothetical protein
MQGCVDPRGSLDVVRDIYCDLLVVGSECAFVGFTPSGDTTNKNLK